MGDGHVIHLLEFVEGTERIFESAQASQYKYPPIGQLSTIIQFHVEPERLIDLPQRLLTMTLQSHAVHDLDRQITRHLRIMSGCAPKFGLRGAVLPRPQ